MEPWSDYLGIELFVLSQKVDAEFSQTNEVFKFLGRGDDHLASAANQLLCTNSLVIFTIKYVGDR